MGNMPRVVEMSLGSTYFTRIITTAIANKIATLTELEDFMVN